MIENTLEKKKDQNVISTIMLQNIFKSASQCNIK